MDSGDRATLIISPFFPRKLPPRRIIRPTRRLRGSIPIDSTRRSASKRCARRCTDSLWRRLAVGIDDHRINILEFRLLEFEFLEFRLLELQFLKFEFLGIYVLRIVLLGIHILEFRRDLDGIGRLHLQ